MSAVDEWLPSMLLLRVDIPAMNVSRTAQLSLDSKNHSLVYRKVGKWCEDVKNWDPKRTVIYDQLSEAAFSQLVEGIRKASEGSAPRTRRVSVASDACQGNEGPLCRRSSKVSIGSACGRGSVSEEPRNSRSLGLWSSREEKMLNSIDANIESLLRPAREADQAMATASEELDGGVRCRQRRPEPLPLEQTPCQSVTIDGMATSSVSAVGLTSEAASLPELHNGQSCTMPTKPCQLVPLGNQGDEGSTVRSGSIGSNSCPPPDTEIRSRHASKESSGNQSRRQSLNLVAAEAFGMAAGNNSWRPVRKPSPKER